MYSFEIIVRCCKNRNNKPQTHFFQVLPCKYPCILRTNLSEKSIITFIGELQKFFVAPAVSVAYKEIFITLREKG